MNKLKLILKGILLYATIIYTIVYICIFDSNVKIILIGGFILIGLLTLCYIFLNEETIIEIVKFTKL